MLTLIGYAVIDSLALAGWVYLFYVIVVKGGK